MFIATILKSFRESVDNTNRIFDTYQIESETLRELKNKIESEIGIFLSNN